MQQASYKEPGPIFVLTLNPYILVQFSQWQGAQQIYSYLPGSGPLQAHSWLCHCIPQSVLTMHSEVAIGYIEHWSLYTINYAIASCIIVIVTHSIYHLYEVGTRVVVKLVGHWKGLVGPVPFQYSCTLAMSLIDHANSSLWNNLQVTIVLLWLVNQ